MEISATTRADLLKIRREASETARKASETVKSVDTLLSFAQQQPPPAGPSEPTRASSRRSGPSMEQRMRPALTEIEGKQATITQIREILSKKGVADISDGAVRNQINTVLSRASWAKRVEQGVYVIAPSVMDTTGSLIPRPSHQESPVADPVPSV